MEIGESIKNLIDDRYTLFFNIKGIHKCISFRSLIQLNAAIDTFRQRHNNFVYEIVKI